MSQHQENTLPRNAKPRLLFNPEDNVEKLHTEVIHDPTISSREDCSAYGVILPLHGRSHRVLSLNAPGPPRPQLQIRRTTMGDAEVRWSLKKVCLDVFHFDCLWTSLPTSDHRNNRIPKNSCKLVGFHTVGHFLVY
ncbi:40S ribosomal protein S22-B [Frankliniella fusca]|uniref:40S ribosomal protein S22-B n=1 Tax=Frankliniella fusca TaxID=407009 RepID=A0AAE1LHF5_9NEOP|nr:40S ribosomal protein S22-B [Frankliniella fusca]